MSHNQTYLKCVCALCNMVHPKNVKSFCAIIFWLEVKTYLYDHKLLLSLFNFWSQKTKPKKRCHLNFFVCVRKLRMQRYPGPSVVKLEKRLLKPNYFKKQRFFDHHFYLPEVNIRSKIVMEYSAGKFHAIGTCWVLHKHFGPV